MLQVTKKFYVGKQIVQNDIHIKQHSHNKYNGDFKAHVIEYKPINLLSTGQNAVHFNISSLQSILDCKRIYHQKSANV